jgi:hypothetical protein
VHRILDVGNLLAGVSMKSGVSPFPHPLDQFFGFFTRGISPEAERTANPVQTCHLEGVVGKPVRGFKAQRLDQELVELPQLIAAICDGFNRSKRPL